MEEELFSWQQYDTISDDIIQFNIIYLKVTIGSFSIGTRFDYAIIDTENGIIELLLGAKKFKFKLHYRVGEKVE